MSKRRYDEVDDSDDMGDLDDLNDGYDQDVDFDDEEAAFERLQKRRDHRHSSKSPRGPRDGETDHGGRPSRRRELADPNVWRSPG